MNYLKRYKTAAVDNIELVNNLNDEQLTSLVIKLDRAFGGLEELAMRPMGEFDELFADMPPLELAGLVGGDFHEDDDFFVTDGDGRLRSALTHDYAQMLRSFIDQIADALTAGDDVEVAKILRSIGR